MEYTVIYVLNSSASILIIQEQLKCVAFDLGKNLNNA